VEARAIGERYVRNMTRFTVLTLVALAAPATSFADDTETTAPYEPIDQFGQIGLGVVRRDVMTGDRFGFDGTLRFGKVWRATDLVRPGFFFELRTVDFDTFEAAIGPQTQFRLGKTTAIQLRTGVGAEAEGRSYALGGVAVAHKWVGMSVTARRMFGDETERETVISANLEVPAIVALFPIGIIYLLGNGGATGP
jgi:hypothetical protein